MCLIAGGNKMSLLTNTLSTNEGNFRRDIRQEPFFNGGGV